VNAGGSVDVTTLLVRWRAGSDEAGEQLMARVHRELRQLAAAHLRRERGGHTLQPSAVVNEVFLRLLPQRAVSWESRAHFYGIAARMTRRVLVDYARRRKAAKRDAGTDRPVTLSGIPEPARDVDRVDVINLHEALSALAALDARQAEIVELRYFGGLTVEEVAEVIGISTATVKREWTTGKLWLRRRMRSLESLERPSARRQ